MAKETKDNFSVQSAGYAAYRPGYPQELFDWLYEHCAGFDTAWDCATGNGQATVKLSEKFKMVYATDISINQLKKSEKRDNIIYKEGAGEKTEFVDNSFDLITVAQGLHWLDHKKFFTEVERVAKPGALFAAWGYNIPEVSLEVDAVVRRFYSDIIGAYWDKERKYVDEQYGGIEIPFEELPCPPLAMSYEWTFEHMVGYLNSWSAVQHYIKDKNANPVDIIKDDLKKAWGTGVRPVTFPVFMRAARIA